MQDVQVAQVEEVEVQVEEGEIIQAADIRAERVQVGKGEVQVEDGEIRQAAVRQARASVERHQVEEEELATVQTEEGGAPGESVCG